MLVAVEKIGPCVVGHVQIGPAIVIVITPHDAESIPVPGIVNPGFLGDLLKRTIAAVVEKQVAFALHTPRATLHQNSLVAAEFFIATEFRELVHIQVDVPRHKEVDVAVAIVVGPGRPGHEAAPPHSGFVGRVFELAISQTAVQRAATEASDKDVQFAVIIEVGDGNSHAPPFAGQPGRLRDVTELKILILMVERNQRIATIAIMFNRGAVHHGNVQFAVVVAVRQGNAAAHGLDDIMLLGRRDMRHGQARLAGNILELRNRDRR